MRCWIIVLVAMLVSMPAAADILVMNNGDSLTGTLVRKTLEFVRFKPDEADEIRVPFKNIKELRTAGTVTILHVDGTVSEREIHFVRATSDQTTEGLKAKDLVNPEDAQVGVANGWSGHMNFSMKLDRGHTNENDVDFDGAMKLWYELHRLTLMGEWEDDWSDGVSDGDKWYAVTDYNYYLGEKTYAELYSAFEADEPALLEKRSYIGAGLGYDLIYSDVQQLRCEGLFSRIHEEYLLEERYVESYWAGGVKSHYEYRFLDRAVTYYADGIGLFDLDNAENIVVKLWTGFRAPLTKHLTINAEVKVELDVDPRVEVDEAQYTYRLKMGYQW